MKKGEEEGGGGGLREEGRSDVGMLQEEERESIRG